MFLWNTQNSLVLHVCTFSLRILTRDALRGLLVGIKSQVKEDERKSEVKRDKSQSGTSLAKSQIYWDEFNLKSQIKTPVNQYKPKSSLGLVKFQVNREKLKSSVSPSRVLSWSREIQVMFSVSQDKSKSSLKSGETSPTQVWVLTNINLSKSKLNLSNVSLTACVVFLYIISVQQ